MFHGVRGQASCLWPFGREEEHGSKTLEAIHWKQAGDPKKAATAMYQFATMENSPLHVVIGTYAYKGVMEKLKTYEENNKKWERIGNSTNIDRLEG